MYAFVSFDKQKNYLCWFIHNMITPFVCISGADVLNDFGNSFLFSCGSMVYVM